MLLSFSTAIFFVCGLLPGSKVLTYGHLIAPSFRAPRSGNTREKKLLEGNKTWATLFFMQIYSPLTCELCAEVFTVPAAWVRHVEGHAASEAAHTRRLNFSSVSIHTIFCRNECDRLNGDDLSLELSAGRLVPMLDKVMHTMAKTFSRPLRHYTVLIM